MKTKELLLSTCAFLAMVIGLLASPVQAAQVQLAWNASIGGPSGYKLYYGQTSGSYQGAIDVGLQTSYSVSGLANGQRYYFSVTAYNAAGSESNHSNEVTTVTAPSPGPSSGLVASYKFDEGSGTTVTDASGLGNHGTISGATRTTSGRYGKALVFDGVNDWVTIPSASSLNLTTGMTLEAWVYPTTTLAGFRAVMVKENANITPYYLYANSDANRPVGGGVIGGVVQSVYGTAQLVTNKWTHLAATYDGTTQRLFVNGVQVASRAQSGAMQVSTGVLRLGGNSLWGEYFKGRIDEVRVYNRALTASEIQTDMNTPVGSAVTMGLAAMDASEVSGGNMAQRDIKARIASAMDKIRAARSASVPSHTPKSSSNKTSSKTLATFVQALDSELMQVGEVDIDRNWTRIELSKPFLNPVVFAKTLSYRGVEPAVVRIHNVDATGFDMQIQNWNDDGTHVSETVGYIIIESGRYTLADGTLVEAGTFEMDSTKTFGSVTFRDKFNVVPVVITAIASMSNEDPFTIRPKDISSEGFEFRLQQKQSNQQGQAAETASYIAWEPSSGTLDNVTFEVGTTSQVTSAQFHAIEFTETFVNPPVLLADVQMARGGDLLNVRWAQKDIHGTAVNIIREEQDHDAHTAESTGVVGYLVIR